jgi:hypothetical protein
VVTEPVLKITVSVLAIGFTLSWFFLLANVVAKDHEQHVKRLTDLVRNQHESSRQKVASDD